jgi:hypothetical protein
MNSPKAETDKSWSSDSATSPPRPDTDAFVRELEMTDVDGEIKVLIREQVLLQFVVSRPNTVPV